MTDIRYEIELVTPGLNFLEGHGEGAKSVVEQTKKTLHQAADRIEKLETALCLIGEKDEELDEPALWIDDNTPLGLFIDMTLGEKKDGRFDF